MDVNTIAKLFHTVFNNAIYDIAETSVNLLNPDDYNGYWNPDPDYLGLAVIRDVVPHDDIVVNGNEVTGTVAFVAEVVDRYHYDNGNSSSGCVFHECEYKYAFKLDDNNKPYDFDMKEIKFEIMDDEKGRAMFDEICSPDYDTNRVICPF